MAQVRDRRGIQQLRHSLLPPDEVEAMTLRSLTSLRWHYPDQVVRVFLSLQRRRAPRVKIVKLLSVVEFTATHRFIQQAFSPGYDTFAAIMLFRRPGGIASAAGGRKIMTSCAI